MAAARALLGLMVLAGAARADALRLADVLARVDERGPEQAAAAALVPIARAEVRSARMLPNPGVVLGAGRSEPLFSAALQARLPIFGQRGAHVRAAERALAQTAGEVAFARWRFRHDARVAYYAVARADDEV